MDKQNICLYDWLSFTTHSMSAEDVVRLLHMEHLQWENKRKGAQGYKSGIYYGSISIFYDGREDMGVWCEMTGQGCRHFESDSDLGWPDLFSSLMQHKCKINRLDIAFDDHTGILDLQQIDADWRAEEYVSTSDFIECTCSRKKKGMPLEYTIKVGSPQSAVRLRIYDKAKERGIYDEHWVRVEMQLREGRAGTYVAKSAGHAGSYFSNVLVNYIRFVDPDPDDSNMWRWPMKPYWAELIQGAERITLWSSPGTEYNEKKCCTFVFQHAGNAIDACLQMYGEEGFLQRLKDRPTKPNPKYAALVQEVQRRQRDELLQDAEREHFEAVSVLEWHEQQQVQKAIVQREREEYLADQQLRSELAAQQRKEEIDRLERVKHDRLIDGFLEGRQPTFGADGVFSGFAPTVRDSLYWLGDVQRNVDPEDLMSVDQEEEKVEQIKLPF